MRNFLDLMMPIGSQAILRPQGASRSHFIFSDILTHALTHENVAARTELGL